MGEAGLSSSQKSKIAAAAALGFCLIVIFWPAKILQAVECPQALIASDDEVVDWSVKRIVEESQMSVPDYKVGSAVPVARVRYESVEDFFEKNPACCDIKEPGGYFGWYVDLGLSGETEVAVLYRLHVAGIEPYEHRYELFGPCPQHRENFRERLTAAQYRAHLRYKRDWPVR